jgi:hypothetical protein
MIHWNIAVLWRRRLEVNIEKNVGPKIVLAANWKLEAGAEVRALGPTLLCNDRCRKKVADRAPWWAGPDLICLQGENPSDLAYSN